MSQAWMGMVLGAALIAAGCSQAATTVPAVTTAPGALSIGLVGSGYSIQSFFTEAAPTTPDATYSHVYFQPTQISVHFAGALSATDSATIPGNVAGAVTDQASANSGNTAEASGGWVDLPVVANTPIDLMALAPTQIVPVGTGSINQIGRYDQIRLTGGGTYQTEDASGTVATGSYTLPSGRLYINQGFEIRSGYLTALKFNFDAAKAMVSAADKVLLKPTSVKVFATYAPIASASF